MDATTPKAPTKEPWYTNKSLWVGLFGLVSPLVAKYLGVSLDPALLASLVVAVLGFIAHDGLQKAAQRIAEAHTQAMAEATNQVKAKPNTAEGAASAINDL